MYPQSTKPTCARRLLSVLADGEWHTTNELARKVGHTFSVAKFVLIRAGYEIEREPHPSRRHQYLYRLTATPQDD